MFSSNFMNRTNEVILLFITLIYVQFLNAVPMGLYNTTDSTLSTPVLCSPASGETLSIDIPPLVWYSVPGSQSYNLQIAIDSSRFTLVQVNKTGLKDTSFSLNGVIGLLRSGTKYFWRVSASDSNGTSAYSTVWSFIPTYTFSKSVFDSLNATFNWFLSNPPNTNGSNFNARWSQAAILDEYGWQCSNTAWNTYRSYWTNNASAANAMEQSNPILYYLRNADQNAFDEIRNTKVEHGVVIWAIYNMGIVVKTKDICFAEDIVARGSSVLTDILDFAIVSHVHSDHYDSPFVSAMANAGKTVYAPFNGSGLTFVDSTKMPLEYNYGDVNIRFEFNHQEANIPVLVSQINLGASADGYTIYDMADARTLSALHPTRHINLFMLHIANGFDPIQASNQIKSDVTLYSHEMELGHSTAANGYRWKYSYSYNKINSQPHASSYILTWGERIAADTSATAIENEGRLQPKSFELFQNYPNPFNPTTNINYILPSQSRVVLKIYDVLGREVKTLINKEQDAGLHTTQFDGSGLTSGIYFCRINDGYNVSMIKMILMK